MKEVSVFAPATVANVGPGFDRYGFPIDGYGDVVIAKRSNSKGIRLKEIRNNPGLLLGPENVVYAVAQKVLEASGEKFGIELILEKNMGIGTGMGSSASSSVAAGVAVNELLENPFSRDDKRMLEAVVHGEAVATKGSGHGDNALPSLLGAFIFITDTLLWRYIRFEGGDKLYFTIVSPTNVKVNTGDARRALEDAPYDIDGLVRVSALLLEQYIHHQEWPNLTKLDLWKLVKLGGDDGYIRQYLIGAKLVIDGVRYNDPKRLGEGATMDRIVTPVRAKFIPGFYNVRDVMLSSGATGFSIAGSGPAVFAVADSEEKAHYVGERGKRTFEANDVQSQVFVSRINNVGAKRI